VLGFGIPAQPGGTIDRLGVANATVRARPPWQRVGFPDRSSIHAMISSGRRWIGAHMSGVGTRVLYENERIILWEFVLAPGEITPVHTHHHDYVFHVVEGSTLEVLDAGGKVLGTFDAPTGAIFPLRLDGDDLVSELDGSRVPATHAARNAGTTPYREILIETRGD
jgi:mannose-6-phosphate isomerase-like protein (cupin superfamily)